MTWGHGVRLKRVRKTSTQTHKLNLSKVDVVAPPAGTRFAPSPMSSIDSQETSNEETRQDRCEASSSERQAGEREGRESVQENIQTHRAGREVHTRVNRNRQARIPAEVR